MREVYETHDNGGRPFSVVIDTAESGQISVTVHFIKWDNSIPPKLVLDIPNAKQVFIGQDFRREELITTYEREAGDTLKGNSVVIQDQDEPSGLKKYYFVGENVLSFRTVDNAEIVRFESPIWGSDVAYPYAVDENGIFYLFIEGVVLSKNQDQANNPNFIPYIWLYRHMDLTNRDDMWKGGFEDKPMYKKVLKSDITNYWIGNKSYFLSCDFPEKICDFGDKKLYIRRKRREEVTKEELEEILQEARDQIGMSRLDKTVICKRDW